MRLATYRHGISAPARLGILIENMMVDVKRLGASARIELPDGMLGFIDLGPDGLVVLQRLLALHDKGWPAGVALPAEDVTLLAPIPRPRKNIFGIGLNYVEHIQESSRSLETDDSLPRQPVIFTKPPTTVIGPGEAIEHNRRITQQLDWEVELAVIIGRRGKRIPKAEALQHVFGYSVIIDISARDCRRGGQWLYSKGQDTFAPFGPMIVTADAVADPQALDLWLTVNGVEKQRSNTRHMLFKVADLISDISQGITLEAGDIIATGTPSGVGAGRDPQEWLWPGDVIEAEVDGIGRLRHPVVAV
jgi:2-keto-4-pentenoate hydratase/2-oxohepta-3-ene-1,7-dioic acid hydratase in catechol pathway